MHKKGITEEVAKKRSRRTVKHQRGIVGADLNFITARRNQASEVRNKERTAAIAKAKSEKKEKEAKKAKVCLSIVFEAAIYLLFTRPPVLSHPQAPRCLSNRWRVVRVADESIKGCSVALVGFFQSYGLCFLVQNSMLYGT